jgi:hypothetical protein
MTTRWFAIVCLLIGCRSELAPPAGSADDLARYLRGVTAMDATTRATEISGWMIDEARWRRIVVSADHELWRDYVRAFDDAAPSLAAQLGGAGEITTRRHYAGDPRLTRSQGRLRWAVPVLYPSMVAELAGRPVDTVFVHDGTRWRALAGLDAVVLARARALDAACAERLALAGPTGRCTEVGWLVADAAVRGDLARFARGCGLAATLCGNPSP